MTPLVRSCAAAALAAAALLEAGDAAAQGAEIYANVCAPCHQADGSGIQGVYPPLANRIGAFVQVPEGRAYLARVVTYGLFGPIEVEDRSYNGLMPPNPDLDDAGVAAVLNHVLSELSPEELPADFAPLEAEEVAGYREPRASFSQMLGEREALLEQLGRQSAAPTSRDARLARGPVPHVTGVAQDYTRWCKGCHRADGMGARGAVPRLRGFVGHFTHLPEGRDYLMRVPGAVFAPIDDARLTAVLNWTLQTFSLDELAPGFEPFTVEEVARARGDPLTNVGAIRARLVAEMHAKSLLSGRDDGFVSARATGPE